jgi:hypothetical protein
MGASSSSTHALNEEQFIQSNLNNAFNGDNIKINAILRAWPYPRTFKSFIESFIDGLPPHVWDNLDFSYSDYMHVRSVVMNIYDEEIERIERKFYKKVCTFNFCIICN